MKSYRANSNRVGADLRANGHQHQNKDGTQFHHVQTVDEQNQSLTNAKEAVKNIRSSEPAMLQLFFNATFDTPHSSTRSLTDSQV
jgi:hypothetical protein